MYNFTIKFQNRQDFPNNESIIQLIITNNEGLINGFDMFRKYTGSPEQINDVVLNADAQSIIQSLMSEYENSINPVLPE